MSNAVSIAAANSTAPEIDRQADTPMGALVAHFKMQIDGLLHVGAHHGQEAAHYHKLGISNVWWVEGNPDHMVSLRDQLNGFPNQRAINALITDVDGKETTFNITKNVDPSMNGVSSSVFELGDHLRHDPETYISERKMLTSMTIDSLVIANEVEANCLVLDVQGAELLALRGAKTLLPKLNYILTEVSIGATYLGGALIFELDEFLSDFTRVHTDLWMHSGRHGDALYIRTSVLP